MINVFLSHPTPFNNEQKKFLILLENCLQGFGLDPVNLGKNQWDNRSPLKPIRELMLSCNAAIIVGYERTHNLIGYEKQYSEDEEEYFHRYSSSVWIQIEAGMAYQAELPLLILKDKRVHPEGILDPNISDYYVYNFDIEKVHKKLSKDLVERIKTWADSIKLN